MAKSIPPLRLWEDLLSSSLFFLVVISLLVMIFHVVRFVHVRCAIAGHLCFRCMMFGAGVFCSLRVIGNIAPSHSFQNLPFAWVIPPLRAFTTKTYKSRP